MVDLEKSVDQVEGICIYYDQIDGRCRYLLNKQSELHQGELYRKHVAWIAIADITVIQELYPRPSLAEDHPQRKEPYYTFLCAERSTDPLIQVSDEIAARQKACSEYESGSFRTNRKR